MHDTDVFTPTMAGLFVAGLSLGAVYALGYTRLGQVFGAGEARDTHTPALVQSGTKTAEKPSGERKGRRRRRVKGPSEPGEGAGEAGEPRGSTTVLPGDFDSVGASQTVHVSPPPGTAERGTSVKAPKPKKKKKPKKSNSKQPSQGKDADEDADADEAGSETGKEASLAVGDDTDAEASLSPSVSGDATAGSARGAGPRVLAPLQGQTPSRAIRASSSSLDTDSSWTHVDRRRFKASVEGQAQGLADAMDATSSDLASTASESPVAERIDVMTNTRGARASPAQRTLAERLVPRPNKTGVDDMLEERDVPTLARVIPVQPRADEVPVPGFSWDDYGDVEDSVLVHDADEEDEGEWGVVKSRHRTRPLQPTAPAASASTSASQAPPTPESMTKKQRQNARKRELAKAAKADTEAARLQGLAKHKRELERLRIIEQSRQGGGKQPSGGMQASVDDRGKLVWE